MQCPHCSHPQHRVVDTREAVDSIRRRRQCEKCGQRFTTYEHVAANLLVVKNDGSREPYDREKLKQGIQTASAKRPISGATIEHAVNQITEALQNTGRAEISSKTIGTLVLDHLSHIDQVAYIRFASVYLNINDLAELRTEIDRLIGR
jgi:transcriptional repressor NrdR